MRFIIFVIDGPGNLAREDEVVEIDKFNEMLESNGHWITAGGVQGPAKSLYIDNRDNKNLAEKKSIFEGAEYYSGFWLINAENQSQAEDLARQGSLACNRKVELRPLF